MRTESTKNFKFGFVLTEAELRRIVGAMEDQLTKLPNAPHVDTTFDIKYRNGALAITSSLDEVLSQENLGSSQIVDLKIKCTAGNDEEINSISMQFHNLNLVPKSDVAPIEFAIKGEERDWTFITSSLLEERALKIKRPALVKFLGVHADWELFVYLTAALGGLMLLLFLITIRSDSDVYRIPIYPGQSSVSPTPKEVSFSEELEDKLRTENIKDPIQAILAREKLLEKRRVEDEAKQREQFEQREQDFNRRSLERTQSFFRPSNYPLMLIIFGLIPPLLIYLTRTFLVLFYPTYNFCWGDYLEVFRKKESVRKFILVGIFIAVIVSFVGSVLANFIKIGR